jgi:hypothetical protein
MHILTVSYDSGDAIALPSISPGFECDDKYRSRRTARGLRALQ